MNVKGRVKWRRLVAMMAIVGATACGQPGAVTSQATSPATSAPPLATPTAPDLFSIQGLYVLPMDGVDHGLATNGTLVRSLTAMEAWFGSQTNGTTLRLSNSPIETVRLNETDAAIAATGANVRDKVEQDLKAQGYDNPRRLYAVWYDGSSTYACGGGAWPPHLVGHVAALYLRGRYSYGSSTVDCSLDRFTTDGVTPQINEFKMLHEILHTLGFVPTCAPHQTRSGHTSTSPTDLMYAGSEGWAPSVLDPAHTDYYRTGRSDCLDLARSAFIVPEPYPSEVPPGW